MRRRPRLRRRRAFHRIHHLVAGQARAVDVEMMIVTGDAHGAVTGAVGMADADVWDGAPAGDAAALVTVGGSV